MTQPEGRRFTNWLAAYFDYTDDTEAPKTFHFWTAMVTLAAAAQRKVWIDLGHFQWTVNMYVMLVAEPGIATKSTSIRIGEKLLRGIKGYHRGPDSLTWQSLIESFREAMHGFKYLDGQIIQAPLTIWSGEFGNLIDPENRELLDFFTAMWDGQAETFKRRTRSHGETEIESPWLNFVGCTTPSWVARNFHSDMVGGGFASRLIVVAGGKKHKLIAYPGISQGGLKTEMEEDLKSDLRHIARLSGPMQLTPEALEWGTHWYGELQRNLTQSIVSRRASGYFARKQTHLHKIAMLFSIAERDDLVIEVDHLKSAHEALLIVEKDMEKVLANITNRQASTRNAQEIVHLLQSGVQLSDSQLYQHLWTFMSEKDFRDALNNLQAAGKVYTSAAGGKAIMKLRS